MTATEAPAMIAPEESETAPVISPKFCAASGTTHSALKIDRARFEERDMGPSYPFLPWAAMSIEFMQPRKYARAGLGRYTSPGALPAPARPPALSVSSLLPNPE